MDNLTLITERLLLRRWRELDREDFAYMNSNPAVCRFLPKLMSEEESNALMDRIETHFTLNGFGLWALELLETGAFVGFTGLTRVSFEAHFTPSIEIGWRLAERHWGKGLATEAANRCLEFGFKELNLDEIVSFTVPQNLASRRIMEKIGMKRDQNGDFDHPKLSPESPLSRHLLYRITPSTG